MAKASLRAKGANRRTAPSQTAVSQAAVLQRGLELLDEKVLDVVAVCTVVSDSLLSTNPDAEPDAVRLLLLARERLKEISSTLNGLAISIEDFGGSK